MCQPLILAFYLTPEKEIKKPRFLMDCTGYITTLLVTYPPLVHGNHKMPCSDDHIFICEKMTTLCLSGMTVIQIFKACNADFQGPKQAIFHSPGGGLGGISLKSCLVSIINR